VRAEVIYEGDTFRYHIEDGMKVIDEHTQDFMNIDVDKVVGAYAVGIMEDGRKVVEVMNINQLKKAWNQRMGGLKEDASSTHTKFRDQMAKKTVINRLCKLIGNTSTDGNIAEISDRLDEIADTDFIAEDVKYEVEQNAQSVEFVDAEIVDEIPGEQPLPDFMTAE
jgi:recombination protein RecT